jgi:hypothetical protein
MIGIRFQCLITIDRGSFAASPWAANSDSAEAISASRPSTACRYRYEAAGDACPRRRIRSLVVAPVAAASFCPVCRRSWNRKLGIPALRRELLVTIGWLALLLGCVHYDLGEREQAEAARQAAYQAGLQAGHGEIIAWSYEMAAWFALTEGRYHDVADYAQAGQQHAGLTNAMIQLVLQQARGQARLSQRREVHASLDHGAKLLEQLPRPEHPENHFVFDHTKWIFYAATCYTWLGDDEPAEEHARELIAYHSRPDGSSNAPMRTAMSHIDLGLIRARHGDLDEAVEHGLTAFSFDRKTEASLLSHAADLDQLLSDRYADERLADEFHQRYRDARTALRRKAHADS